MLQRLSALVALPLAAVAAPSGVPPSFDCKMRQLAYRYGQQLLPRMGQFESLWYALGLNVDSEDCPAVPPRAPSPAPPAAAPPARPAAGAVFVAPGPPGGGDGTEAALRSIQAAADLAAGRPAKQVVLRGGTHYIDASVVLTPQHSGLSFIAYPGEAPVVSGGARLSVKWEPFGAPPAPAPPPAPPAGGWVEQDGYNYVWGLKVDGATVLDLGEMANWTGCLAACTAQAGCHAYTWHDQNQGKWARKCLGRTDGEYEPRAQGGHYSGHDSSARPSTPTPPPPPGGRNVWVADVRGQTRRVVRGLQLDGVRATRARYPNLPHGIEALPHTTISSRDGVWTPPDLNRFGPSRTYIDLDPAHQRNDTTWGYYHYQVGIGGLCSVYDPPVSYWCSNSTKGGNTLKGGFRTPRGVTPAKGALPNAPYNDTSAAVVFVWHPKRWANWMFDVGGVDRATGNITFGRGGMQGARGGDTGGDWFVEGVLEELDHPGEFFHDEAAGKLYLWHNATGAPPADMAVVAPQVQVLVNHSGTQWDPVRDVRHEGITYVAAADTYMEPHGVPSAGDWALERFGAIFLQGTEGVVISNCTFERLDGNGVMVSGYNRNATVTGSDFAYLGGNAVACWGHTNETEGDNHPQAGVDGTDGNHPRYTAVTACTAREVGLYEKQSSFFVSAKAAQSTVRGNVFFNGPRAGINFNDGFGGGDDIGHNLVFSTCRESGDHGPLNSWDRQVFLTTVRTGEPSVIPAWRDIHHNYFIDNYSPQEAVDNDDGSSYYHTHDNFFIYGNQGLKADFGGHDNRHQDNVYAYVHGAISDATSQIAGHEVWFTDNRVIMTGFDVGPLSRGIGGKYNKDGPCKKGENGTATKELAILGRNTYYTANASVFECGMPLGSWQALDPSHDRGSTVGKIPSDDSIIEWGKAKLGME